MTDTDPGAYAPTRYAVGLTLEELKVIMASLLARVTLAEWIENSHAASDEERAAAVRETQVAKNVIEALQGRGASES